jgi:hypothetical protein
MTRSATALQFLLRLMFYHVVISSFIREHSYQYLSTYISWPSVPKIYSMMQLNETSHNSFRLLLPLSAARTHTHTYASVLT